MTHAEAQDAKPSPSEDAKKLHADYVTEIHKREISSSENFDRSVLTFSSAGLALSIGFLKDFLGHGDAAWVWSLYCSWIAFTVAIVFTMVSFQLSGWALGLQKQLAYAYYIEGDESAFARRNWWNSATKALNITSASAFVVGMILSVVFISLNAQKGLDMKHNSRPDGQRVERGMPAPSMQKVPTPSSSSPMPATQAPVSSPPSAAPSSPTTGSPAE